MTKQTADKMVAEMTVAELRKLIWETVAEALLICSATRTRGWN
jgi:hypothetical protein